MKPRSGVEVIRIQAAVLRRRGGPLTIESLEMEGPRDDEVLVRIVASGICHTDIAFRDDWYEADDAVVLGHEGAGVAERVGKDVKGVKAGDHVVLSYQSCGRCRPCRSGHPAHCRLLWEANFGFQRLDGSNALHRSGVRGHFFGQSSFATHSLATERNIVNVSKDLPLEVCPAGPGADRGRDRDEFAPGFERGSIARLRTGHRPSIDHGGALGAPPGHRVDVSPATQAGPETEPPTRLTTAAGMLRPVSQRSPARRPITGERRRPRQPACLASCIPRNVALRTANRARLVRRRKTLASPRGAVRKQFSPRLRAYRAGLFPFDGLENSMPAGTSTSQRRVPARRRRLARLDGDA